MLDKWEMPIAIKTSRTPFKRHLQNAQRLHFTAMVIGNSQIKYAWVVNGSHVAINVQE